MMRFNIRPGALLALSGALALGACNSDNPRTTLPLDPAPSVTELTVTPASVTLPYLGATSQLQAELRNALGDPVNAPRIYWQSLDTGVVSVDTLGVITGKVVGSGRVTAQFLELADTVAVTVTRVPVAMSISTDSILFTELGRTGEVRATVWDGSGDRIPTPSVTWTSSAPAVASVDTLGTVKALADGTTVITVTTDTLVRTAAVRVASRPASMTVTPASISLDGISDTARVITVIHNAAGVPMYPLQPTYTSSDTSVAKVDFVGFVIARKAGSATITVASDTLEVTVPVTVVQTPHTIKVVPDTATLAPGATATYVALVRDRFAQNIPGAPVTWSSSDTAVATVDAAGVVTAVAVGSATITATNGSVSDGAKVTVAAPPAPLGGG